MGRGKVYLFIREIDKKHNVAILFLPNIVIKYIIIAVLNRLG